MESAIWDFMKPKIDAYVDEKMVEKDNKLVEKDKIIAAQGREIIELKKIIEKNRITNCQSGDWIKENSEFFVILEAAFKELKWLQPLLICRGVVYVNYANGDIISAVYNLTYFQSIICTTCTFL